MTVATSRSLHTSTRPVTGPKFVGLAVVLAALLLTACGDDGGAPDDPDDGEVGASTATSDPAGPTGSATADDPGATGPTEPTGDATSSPDEGGADDATANGRSRPVTVVLDWTPNTNHAGMYVAQQRGWYADAGLDVDIIQPGQQGAQQMLASGEAQVGVSVAESLVPARAQGVPIVSLAAIVQTNTSSLLSLPSDDVSSPADLEGLRYGGFGGQLERALIDRLVTCDGGDPSEVSHVEVGNVDYRVGLERDLYDVVWVFDGWDGVRLDLAGVEHDRIEFRDHLDCIPNWYTPLLATTEAMVADQPDLLADFMAATARGYEVAMTDPEAAADALLAGAPELDAELVRASADWLAEWYADSPGDWGEQDPQVWSRFVDFLVEAGLIEQPIDVEPAFTNEFLPDDG